MNAYDLYLKARELFYSRDGLALRQSLEIYQQAIDRDPGFARAWEGMASVYAVIQDYEAEGYEQISPIEAAALAVPAARKALELDPTLAMPHAVLGMVFGRNFDFEAALRELDTAIEIDSRESTAWMWRGMRTTQLGYLEESLRYFREAHDIAPDVGINNDHLGWVLLAQGNFEEAYPYIGRSLDKGREPYSKLLAHKLHTGDFLDARMAAVDFLKGYEMLPYLMPIFERSHEAGERQRLIDRFWVKLKQLKPDHTGAYRDALFLSLVGDFGKASEIFFENPGWRHLVWQPSLTKFRASEQFKDFVRQTKMDTYWRKHGWPDLCRPLGDDDFECD